MEDKYSIAIVIIVMFIPIFISIKEMKNREEDNYIVDYNEYEKSEEALKWLKENNNPCAFAGNRFKETKDAIEFVSKLYSLGAEEIQVTGIFDEPERIEEEGGAYAETLIIKLPEEVERRKKIFKIYEHELENYDFNSGEEVEDVGQDTIVFWWD
jgi:hypothetical protein